jgi:hypothetical protein
VIGFLEESPHVRSATRLIALLMALGCLALVAVIGAVALLRPEQAPGIIAAIGVPLVGLAGGTWGALKERVKDDNSSTETPESTT